MPCTARMKGMSQTSIRWWHSGFLHKPSQHPQPTHHILDLQPSTSRLSTSMTTNNSIHPVAPNQLRLKLRRHFLHDCIGHWLWLFLPSKTVRLTWLICLPCPQHSLCLGVPDACPKSWWLQWGVGVRGCLWASTHSCGIAIACCKGGKSAAKLSPVAIGSACTSHIHTPADVIFIHECATLSAKPHEFLTLVSQGADAGVWRSKLTLCL